MSTIGPVILTSDDLGFLETLREHLRDGRPLASDAAEAQEMLERSGLPKQFWGFALTVYQPGRPRLMVVRAAATPPFDSVRRVVARTLAHPRSGEFDFGDRRRCRLQVDFLVDELQPQGQTRR